MIDSVPTYVTSNLDTLRESVEELRARARLLFFAAAHFTMLFVVHNKHIPIWRPALASKVELAMSVEFLVILSSFNASMWIALLAASILVRSRPRAPMRLPAGNPC